MRDAFAAKARAVTMNDVKDMTALCLEMTAIDKNATDDPIRFADVALIMS